MLLGFVLLLHTFIYITISLKLLLPWRIVKNKARHGPKWIIVIFNRILVQNWRFVVETIHYIVNREVFNYTK